MSKLDNCHYEKHPLVIQTHEYIVEFPATAQKTWKTTYDQRNRKSKNFVNNVLCKFERNP